MNKDKQYSLSDFNMTSTKVKLGKTPAAKYQWFDHKGNAVAKFTVFNWWDGKNIEDLRVYAQYKNHGLSYQLLDYATKKLGVKSLAVEKSNTRAKHVYDKYGFKVTETDEKYYYMSK